MQSPSNAAQFRATNILREVDWWRRQHPDPRPGGCPTPQSHLLRELEIDQRTLRALLDRLVAGGILAYRPSGVPREPDVCRVAA